MRAPLQFSLFFFAANPEDVQGEPLYRLLIDSVKLAEARGFEAVWTPERHFADFGGLYPSPSVISAALAMVTTRLKLRAGSVVAPLGSALRIAEEWAVVDNLSGGRIGISFASGWHPNDFVLAPDVYPERRADLAAKMALIRRLWAGEAIELPNGEGTPTPTRILPRPIQAELPVWLTCQQDGSFGYAGEAGYGALTNLNYKKMADLERKAGLYHEAHQSQQGRRGHFTLMAHGFVGRDEAHAEDIAGNALQKFLETRVEMDAQMHSGLDLSEEDRAFLARRGVEQFLGETSLIGTMATCTERALEFYRHGVDELACLIDFGVGYDEAMASLERIAQVKDAVLARL